MSTREHPSLRLQHQSLLHQEREGYDEDIHGDDKHDKDDARVTALHNLVCRRRLLLLLGLCAVAQKPGESSSASCAMFGNDVHLFVEVQLHE